MTDHELLEIAAKAAGIADGDVFYDMDNDKEWNPLTDVQLHRQPQRIAVVCKWST